MKTTDHKKSNEKRGLYFALAVCLVAVGIAAWGTYNSVADYLSANEVVEPSVVNREDEDPGLSRAQKQQAPALTAPTEESAVEPQEEAPETVAEAPPEPQEELQEVNAPVYSLRETFIMPVAGAEITAPFSGGELVYNSTMKDYRTHMGEDLAAEKGQTVFSCNNGLVKSTYTDLLLGNVVIVEHGDYLFWYCGLGDTFLVEEGDVITNAQAIGSVTTVPSETDSVHLHLQVEKDGSFIDPTTLPFE